MVVLEALAPFWRAIGEPPPLAYLDAARLQAAASPFNKSEAGQTMAQLVTHHTVNGCSLSSGDLLGTGMLSGATPDAAGSLLERSAGGKVPITVGSEQRTSLEDGDRVILRSRYERIGFCTIGLGECSATVLPALPLSSQTVSALR
jgi:fumarylacetoacetase